MFLYIDGNGLLLRPFYIFRIIFRIIMFNSIDDVLSPQESINNRTNIHVWIFVMPSVVLLAGVYLWLGSGRGFTLLDVLKGTLSWISLKFSLNAIDLDFVPTPILDFLAKTKLF